MLKERFCADKDTADAVGLSGPPSSTTAWSQVMLFLSLFLLVNASHNKCT